jgi:DNA-binding NtrC family response regulator
MSTTPLVVVIDDESGSRESMAIAVEKAGFPARTFDDAAKALEYVRREPSPKLAICDLRMPGMDGLAFLQAVRSENLDLGVMLVTGFGSIESAVEAMQVGADDYLTKPVDLYELRRRVTNLLENRRLKEEITTLREMLDEKYGFENLIGGSEPMRRLFDQMRQVAPTQSTVLITGESGTGKELVAKALHQASPRRDQRFLALNCGAIPSDILESELFGHERGSFTGAVARKIGKFELAQHGTIFLDEISELYPELQVKLLRVLEERQVMRVGGDDLIDLDFRLIAATNRDLEREVTAGRFREDLYYRLKVVTLRIAPLRERMSDLPLLVEHFLRLFGEREAKPGMRLSAEALQTLQSYGWPGNVRELRNVIETVAIFHPGGDIKASQLPTELRNPPAAAVLAPAATATVNAHSPLSGGLSPASSREAWGALPTMAEIERRAILDTLQHTEGRRAEAARILDIGLRTLQRKLKDYRDQGYFAD